MGSEAFVHVKREAGGLVVEISAPRLAKFVHDYCKQQSGRVGPTPPETPDLRELGPIWSPCQAAGIGPGVKALSHITKWRGADGPFLEGETGAADTGPDSVNLFMLRAAKALDGPVTYTFKGLYSKEAADNFHKAAVAVIVLAYKDLTSSYDKRTNISVNDVGPQLAVPASAPVPASPVSASPDGVF